MSKRILIVSDSITNQTGYATVTNNIIKNLDPDCVIGHLGFALNIKNTLTMPKNVHVYSTRFVHKKCGMGDVIHYYFDGKVKYFRPNLYLDEVTKDIDIKNQCACGSDINGDGYHGQSTIFYVAQHFKPDVVLSINDIWGLHHINFLKNRKNFDHISYMAVDSDCFPFSVPAPGGHVDTIKFINHTNKIVVFTDWAKKNVFKTVRLITDGQVPSNFEVIPHGVEKNNFFPLDNKRELRNKYFKDINIDIDNMFLIGCVARNQPRKRLDAIFQTLQILINKYEKSNGKKMYVHFHCSMKDAMGWNLPWLAKYYDVQDRCIFDNALKPMDGMPIENLNEIINTYDVHFLPTNSEGWGLPILETMAAGIPNVISDYSAHGDWAKDAALKVKLAARIHEPVTNHIKGIIDINDAAKQISLLYNSAKMCRSFSTKGLKLANKLQWNKVCDKWNQIFDEIEEKDQNRYDIIRFKDDIHELPENPIDTEFKLIED